jgi:hypothetical protein
MAENTLQKIAEAFRARTRRLLIEYGLFQTVFLVLVTLAALMIPDWRFRFSPDLRLLALLIVVAVLAACWYFCFHRALRRPWSDEEVFGYMDRALGESGDVLTALRDLGRPEELREWESEQGKQVIAGVVHELEERVRGVAVEPLLNRRPITVWRRLAVAALAVFLVGLFFPRDPVSGASYLSIGLRRIVMPYAAIYWPQKTRILVQAPESAWRVPRGEPLTIRARIDGEMPAWVEIVYRSGDSANWITERMAVEPGRAEAKFAFSEMNEPVTFYCLGGDDRERRHFSVSVAERPLITGIKATYVYPPYMRLPRKVTTTGQLAAPEGTDVKLEFTASAELSQVNLRLCLDGEAPTSAPPASLHGSTFAYDLRLSRSGSYTVELTDRNNLRNGKPERYEIRTEPDNPPEITLEDPVRDMILTAGGRVRVKFKAKDDYNLSELAVMLGPAGATGQALSDKITGPFWNVSSTLHPVGEGEFDLDFKTQADGLLKHLNLRQGAELELWMRAVDCNPSGKGISESVKVRLSLLRPTDFMEAVVLQAKELMADARVGWYAAAGARHDGEQWLKRPAYDKLLAATLDGEQAAERAAAALALRFPELVQHMQRNRMQDLFMGKRLDRIGARINDLSILLPQAGKKIAAGQPASAEEAQPARRQAKMAGAVQSVLGDQNRGAWQMRILYDRLADWVALQSVLLKTRRIEEFQRDINAGTDRFVTRTLGREARELDDTEIRTMRELASQQETVFDMEESVEKALAELILQADKDGRKKVWESLAKSFDDLRRNRIKDKLKQAATFLRDARGDVVRADQRLVLETVATVNRGLIKAGDEVPDDPPASLLAQVIDDPRNREEAVAKVAEPEGEAVEADAYKTLGRLDILRVAAANSLDETLEQAALRQEDARNRTRHVAERSTRSARYTFLRVGLLSQRQAKVSTLLDKALAQVSDYGKAPSEAAGGKPGASLPPDPALDRTRERLTRQVREFQACGEEANRLLQAADFSALTVGIQNHLQRGARELRTFLQESEKKYKLACDRQAAKFFDPFERPYLVREQNLSVVVDEGRNLEWSLVLESAAQRESEMLAGANDPAAALSAPGKAAVERLVRSARAHGEEAAGMVGALQSRFQDGVQDPSDPEKAAERIKPLLQEKVLALLDPKAFRESLTQFDRKEYRDLALRQDALRRNVSGSLVALSDLIEALVPPKKPVDDLAKADAGEVVADAAGFIEYRDEQPSVLADRIEKDGAWIDEQSGSPEVRKALVRRLREMSKFDPRYARLQSAYFQAVAQHFQANAKEPKKHEEGKNAVPNP